MVKNRARSDDSEELAHLTRQVLDAILQLFVGRMRIHRRRQRTRMPREAGPGRDVRTKSDPARMECWIGN